MDAKLDFAVKSIDPPEGCVVNAYGIRRIYWDELTGLSIEFHRGGGFGTPVPEKKWLPTKETGDEYK